MNTKIHWSIYQRAASALYVMVLYSAPFLPVLNSWGDESNHVAEIIDEKRLWLPQRYQALFPALLRSAIAAKSLDRCATVLEGTLDLEQSEHDRPKFRILCRQPSGLSYNEIVDGSTYKPLTSRNYTPLEKMQMKEVKYSVACRKDIASQLTLMKDLIWLTAGNPKAANLNENQAVFLFDFNASNQFGKSLFYRARCVVNKEGRKEVKITARTD